MREIQVLIEFGGNPDVSGFDAAMLGGLHRGEIGFSMEGVKIEIDVFKQLLLIAFDGEVVVRVALLNQILSQFALGEQGIGGDGFVLDIDDLQQWDGGFDFVGLFLLVAALYRQGAHFFGCSTACFGDRWRS
jgi:hypothetical protein